jgi:rhamnulose-1-phosphate aldolase
MNSFVEEEISKISEVAGYLWNRGWSERNAGNISFDLTDLIDFQNIDLSRYPFRKTDLPKASAGLAFFMTGTGERLRDLIKSPQKAAGIIAIDKEASGYYLIWGGESKSEFRPTSEFVTHIGLHLFNRERNNHNRCIIHTHPIELIAISHHPSLGCDEEALNKALWSMLPEIRVFVPRGISLAPYELPGSEALANLTIKGLVSRDVVLWSKHGALATGKDAIEAFDYLDVANKGAFIYLKCLQAGYVPEGMTDQQMKDLEIFI